MLPEPRERSRKYWRTPKAVMRSLGRSFELKERYATEQILEWMNAAAPMAVAKLIRDVVDDDKHLAQRAAMDILDRVVGRPRPQAEGSGLQLQDGGRKIEIIITDPQAAEGCEAQNFDIVQT